MKRWIWIPIAIILYFLTPVLLESYTWISSAPLQTNQIGLVGQLSILLPLIFVLEYIVLYKLISVKQITLLVLFPISMFLLAFMLGFFYLNSVNGLLDHSFLILVTISNLALFSIGTFFFYRKQST
jgi:hypothetical protein